MSEQETPSFILPIICPHCHKELEMTMDFGLLPPKEEKQDDIIEEAKTE